MKSDMREKFVPQLTAEVKTNVLTVLFFSYKFNQLFGLVMSDLVIV